MAQILVRGAMSTVELTTSDDDGVDAACVEHSIYDSRLSPAGNCSWQVSYDDWNDATAYAADHADRGD